MKRGSEARPGSGCIKEEVVPGEGLEPTAFYSGISCPRQARRVFRRIVQTGRRGHPRLVLPRRVLIAQAIKRHIQRRLLDACLGLAKGNPTEAARMAGYMETE